MRKPRPLAGKNPGTRAAPTANQRRAPKKPRYQDAADRVGGAVGRLGSEAKHVGSSTVHIGHRVVKAINPFD